MPQTIPPRPCPTRPSSTLLSILLLWIAFYASFTLITPPLLDDADSVHAEVAREMLLRHDYITLYANGIRYLEKAPLLYWSMAASMRLSQLFGATNPQALTVAARIPLALTILALALLTESFARRLFASAHSGLYASLITLSSFGIFLFTRILIPDGMVCLWTTLALYCLWRTDESPSRPRYAYGFAAACALNVLTKGLIGIVFPVTIAALYLLLSHGLTGTTARLRKLPLATSLLLFLAIAAPWHILAGLANPTQGHPTPFHFVNHHWQIPLPTDGNVRGWFWFYFMNEHLLRYLNLRVPHDYDTAPLWLFWGLCLIWLMPWSAFLFHAVQAPARNLWQTFRTRDNPQHIPRPEHAFHEPLRSSSTSLLLIWAAFILLFFSLSTRQEYYVLPALPALALLIAGWLSIPSVGLFDRRPPRLRSWRINARIDLTLLILGALFLLATAYFLLHTRAPAPNTDLAQLLAQNPGDYALSMGHFLDLNAQALGLFCLPLAIAALGLFAGPLAAYLLRQRHREHAANLALAAGAFTFLLAAHLGLQVFSPVLTSAQLAQAIAPQVSRSDLIVIHGEYESGSALSFYLQRPTLDSRIQLLRPLPNTPEFIHILEGRSSNLWYGSFFPDAPNIFETPASLAAKWQSPQRIFLWQSLTDPPNQLPPLPGPVYILVKSGGKEIVSNQPNR